MPAGDVWDPLTAQPLSTTCLSQLVFREVNLNCTTLIGLQTRERFFLSDSIVFWIEPGTGSFQDYGTWKRFRTTLRVQPSPELFTSTKLTHLAQWNLGHDRYCAPSLQQFSACRRTKLCALIHVNVQPDLFHQGQRLSIKFHWEMSRTLPISRPT